MVPRRLRARRLTCPFMRPDPLTLIVVAFVAYRLARAVTTDTLIEGWRFRLEDWGYVNAENPALATWRPVYRSDGTKSEWLTVSRGKLVDLIVCPYCLSQWLAVGVLSAAMAVWPWELGWYGWIAATGAAGVAHLLLAVDGRDG